jgi:hypothetical protein
MVQLVRDRHQTDLSDIEDARNGNDCSVYTPECREATVSVSIGTGE